MPTTNQNPKEVNAKRFAALFAGFDTGNPSDEEALSKGRMLRRMATQNNSRIVDLLEVPEVMQAIDDQLQPVRHDQREVKAAQEQAAALREELTERTRDVRSLAEMLKREKEELTERTRDMRSLAEMMKREKEAKQALQMELKTAKSTTGCGSTSSFMTPSFGAQSWVFEAAIVGLGLWMLITSAIF
jgi:DNA repair exonuclease SbcCD ATPase subunit